jgi:hypothetical protein
MTKFMQALLTSYSMYFNKKYERVGTLFQSAYKATNIFDDTYLLHISRYIHRNPAELTGSHPVSEYPYSSYPYYLKKKSAAWVHPEPVLEHFRNPKGIKTWKALSYQAFVEGSEEFDVTGLTLD